MNYKVVRNKEGKIIAYGQECSGFGHNLVDGQSMSIESKKPEPEPLPEITYRELRAKEYPTVGDILDSLFHSGLFSEEMAIKIQAVKNKYPKT